MAGLHWQRKDRKGSQSDFEEQTRQLRITAGQSKKQFRGNSTNMQTDFFINIPAGAEMDPCAEISI